MKGYGQPVVSRETRRLLITIIVAITALWVLARLRFQERPIPAAPVPSVLAQLRPSSFDELPQLVADLRPAIESALSRSSGGRLALRVREDAAVTLMPGADDTIVAADRATGLAIVRHPSGPLPNLMPWRPRISEYPRYLVAADLTGDRITLRPVFIGGLIPAASPLWTGELWLLPPATAISPGSFMFTTDGGFAGLVTTQGQQLAIVPATLLTTAVDQLLASQGRQPGELGIEIDELTRTLARATGATAGIVVTAVDPSGPAAGHLSPAEVIEAVDGDELSSLEHWRARIARVHAGDTVSLRVRGRDGVREESITAVAPEGTPDDDDDATLGVTLSVVPKAGSRVVSVQPRSRAAESGLQEGDLITLAAGQTAPTPAYVIRTFASLPQGGFLLVAVTRGSEHRVIAIEK